jgi:predicted phosphodiesterase
VLIGSLRPDTRYHYQFRWRPAGSAPFSTSPNYSFHTQRPPGSTFTFTIQADSHLDEHTDPALYRQTIANVLADAPDFHVDLGDTFMTEKHVSREDAATQYLAQRYYFGLVGATSPVFLVLGNHDGETAGSRPGTSADSLAVWSNAMRKRYFPNPLPDTFYSGNKSVDLLAGQLQDYYAWQWGDALFIVLDPFWYGLPQRGRNDNWSRTLGPEQYQWLKRTLEQSKTRFKFVFIHHLVGGIDKQSRGGIEAAPFYEWGGHNADGTDGFADHRPGWPAPIHQLLVENKVSIVLHGHDHLFAKQDLNGIVYQGVPQPGAPKGGARNAADYGYASGVILDGSGHLRVRISPDKAEVDYVRSSLPPIGTNEATDGSSGYSYIIAAPGVRAR